MAPATFYLFSLCVLFNSVFIQCALSLYLLSHPGKVQANDFENNEEVKFKKNILKLGYIF